MVGRKKNTEVAKLTFEVRREDEFELWRSRSWGPADGQHAVIVDTFPNDPKNPAMTENLTDMLIFNQMQKMNVSGYYQVHLFAKQPHGNPNNRNLNAIDDEVIEQLFTELVNLAKKADVVVMAYGSIVRRLVIAEERESQLLSKLKEAGLEDKLQFLVEPNDHSKKAAPVSRKVREAGLDWTLMTYAEYLK